MASSVRTWKKSELLSPGEVPERLRRGGRPLDPDLLGECCFMRCQPEYIDGERLASAGIRFPDTSVNRCKYSEPGDALGTKLEWGFVRFRASDVPTSVEGENNARVDFSIVHVPIDENYSHCEIRAFKGGVHVKKGDKIPDTVKKIFRQLLCEKTWAIHDPRTPEPAIAPDGYCTRHRDS
jgi:hypothetical protein